MIESLYIIFDFVLYFLVFFFIRTCLLVLVNSDIVTSELFNCESMFKRIVKKEQNKILHDIFVFVIIVLFITIPFIQTLLVFFAYGLFPKYQIISILDTTNMIEFVQVVAENLDLEFLIERRKIRRSDVYDLLYNKQIYINFVIYILLNTNIDNELNVTHCFFVYFVSRIMTSGSPFIRALFNLGLKKDKKMINRVNRLQKVESKVWVLNQFLQGLILTKLVFTAQAGYLEWLYISLIPVIYLNM